MLQLLNSCEVFVTVARSCYSCYVICEALPLLTQIWVTFHFYRKSRSHFDYIVSLCLTWLSCLTAPEGEVETGGHSGAVVGVVKGPVAAVKSKLRGFYCIFYHKNRNSNNCETETVHNQDPNGALLHHRPGLDTPMEISHCQSFQIMDFISLIWLVLWGPLCSSKLSGTIQH